MGKYKNSVAKPDKKPLSSSAEKICDAAASHFAVHGYGASSLSMIAEQVGIRKASIYAHFSGKDELYLQVFERAVEKESAFAEKCFRKDAKEMPGFVYCGQLKPHYAKAPYFRFLLRAAYLPPKPVRALLVPGYKVYQQKLCDLFLEHAGRQFAFPEISRSDLAEFTEAYIGIVDSLHGELLYAGSTRFEVRFKALWRVFSDSIRTSQSSTSSEK